ncbi:hypothetical protein KBY93_13540 [Synechococcus sp. J7-Johnson]|uniref:primase-helicase zinc-binding domain-containing protein n=1 Tax=Synechococcus sp. J7-Johnson TaxID=2823737 RepID=UPI0020CBFB18|nr:primase-helicase zinc-binding domain-containing protein [Synechococcus sp. J7-Johnson]MCP9841645.1 hypothetical protein [Synechococcus sp. J7-Johnson]
MLDGKHHPCPVCGGTDRFRFDDLDGRGTWLCNQCAPKPGKGSPAAGDGMDLLRRVKSWSFPDAADAVRSHLGAAQFRTRRAQQGRRLQAVPSPAPLPPEPPVLATLAQPIKVANPYRYSNTQRITRVDLGEGRKRFDVMHLDPKTSAWASGAQG